MAVQATKQVQPSSPIPREKRMGLTAIKRGKVTDSPVRLLVYGVEGIGKSTLAGGAPSPVFLGPEDGTFHLDVARFPEPRDWQDIMDAVTALLGDGHEYKTLAIDTLDWIEPLIWSQLVRKANKPEITNIEDFGYGKGYTKALDTWRELLSLLERVRKEKRMHVILLAHSQVKTWKNPEGDDFDRYTLKIHDKAAGLCKEWCDAVLFTNHETYADKDSRTKRVKGVSTGARLLYTQRTAAYDAKNRYDLPDTLPLNWEELWSAIQAHQPAEPGALVAAIEEKLTRINNAQLSDKVHKRIVGHEDDASLLAQLNDWLNGKLSQTEEG